MSKLRSQQRAAARVQLPERHQMRMVTKSLEQMVPKNHLARSVVRFVDSLDLSSLYDTIKATEHNVGRPPIDPRILFCLWLYSTLEGETSARRIERLSQNDDIYKYLCGEVSVNYHTLSDFRTQNNELLDLVLTDSIAVLHHNGLVKLETIAQDGMRVRASAGSGSFKRQDTLEEARTKAADYLEQLKSEGDDEDENSGNASSGQKAARERAAREKKERLDDACKQMEDLQERWEKRNSGRNENDRRSEPRASKTDPDARRMKMGDGGFRPAYNVQFANDADALLIIKPTVEQVGSDAGLLAPMYSSVCETYNTVPKSWLADGGFSSKPAVASVERAGTKFYGPVAGKKQLQAKGKDPYARQPKDSDSYAKYRERMGTDEAREIYRQRSAAAEFPNAVCRNHGLNQFRCRGIEKVKSETLWQALAYNLQRLRNLLVPTTNETYLEFLMSQ